MSTTTETTGSAATLERYASSLLGVFGAPKLALVRGQGSYVWDADGRRYLDLLGGIAVNCLGHAHPGVAEALARQAGTLIHTSNFFTTPQQVELAERLLAVAQAPAGSAVFFANSGSEANEAAIKLARRTGRPGLLAAEDAFHGRTCGAVSLTHKPAYREPFLPLLPGVLPHVPFGDAQALRAAFAEHGDRLGALFLEPVQGEAGVVPAPEGYLRLARDLTREHGALLVLDEVQSGIGRTGRWFAHQESGVVPDAITVAKGLGGGMPIGALVTMGPEVTGLLTAGQHGTTFGGNPLACAAGLAVLRTIESQGVLDRVRETSAWFAEALAGCAEQVTEVRAAGLLVGITLSGPFAARAAQLAQEEGFIVNPVRPDTLRLAPSLLATREELGSFVDALPGLLARAAREG
ncbi:acetylornithine transaminase [Agilicoccus flavus]|uniref:acetylornithine transaminase n=1 Tax=Agilicoccus flavus TaxID=2775968 RepID=UPI001CF7047D|nr:acetylornithine transaminase [Agilicoccus flavus]